MNVDQLAARYPRLYHMAEADTWPAIKANGLMSTSAALDYHAIGGLQRSALEAGHRPEKVQLGKGQGAIILRDQKPMPPERLARGLRDGITPTDWYKLLNAKVFMWAEEHRLLGLLNARQYRNLEHDVLTIDTASLLAEHAADIWLCHMNSGNTFPIPHHQGATTFRRILDYPIKANGSPQKEVVEVVVDYHVPHISKHVTEVRRMKGETVLGTLAL
jgi:hypothetical protein